MVQRIKPDRSIGRKVKSTSLKQDRSVCEEEIQKTHLCQVRIDRKLLDTIKNAVQSAKMGGDFRYGNVSDFIRGALIAYKNGMKLVEVSPTAERQVQGTTLWMDDMLCTFWRSLPRGCRREILERALWTKLKQI